MKNIKVLKWVLIVSIVIVLNLFFNFATRLIYKPVIWDKFCPQKQETIQPTTKNACVQQGGAWNEQGYPIYPDYPVKGATTPTPARLTPAGDPITGYCDLNFTCNKEFTTASQLYNRNVFVILVVLGLVSLIAGFFLANQAAVSLGLSLGGVVSLIVASVRYWSDMDDYLRVIILGLALAALIWLGIKKARE